MNPEFKDLADDIYRRRVLRARALTPGQKLAVVLELQNEATTMLRASVRIQFPKADAEELNRLTTQRRKRIRQVSDHGFFQPLTIKP